MSHAQGYSRRHAKTLNGAHCVACKTAKEKRLELYYNRAEQNRT